MESMIFSIEVGIVEDAAEDALRHQVLDEHLLDRWEREVGIDGLAAEFVKSVEALNEGRIGTTLVFDLLFHRAGDLRDVVFEVGDGCVPFFIIRFAITEECLQQFDEIGAVADVFVQALPHAVLVENRALRRLKDDVGAGITLGELGADLLVEVVVLVLGLPVAAGQAKGVEQGAIDADGIQLGTAE
jgi:hypothetical protein